VRAFLLAHSGAVLEAQGGAAVELAQSGLHSTGTAQDARAGPAPVAIELRLPVPGTWIQRGRRRQEALARVCLDRAGLGRRRRRRKRRRGDPPESARAARMQYSELAERDTRLPAIGIHESLSEE